jgi:hypothetical protein
MSEYNAGAKLRKFWTYIAPRMPMPEMGGSPGILQDMLDESEIEQYIVPMQA